MKYAFYALALLTVLMLTSANTAASNIETMPSQPAKSTLFNTNHGRVLRFIDPDNGNVCYAPVHIRIENGKEAYSMAVGWSCLPHAGKDKKR